MNSRPAYPPVSTAARPATVRPEPVEEPTGAVSNWLILQRAPGKNTPIRKRQ